MTFSLSLFSECPEFTAITLKKGGFSASCFCQDSIFFISYVIVLLEVPKNAGKRYPEIFNASH